MTHKHFFSSIGIKKKIIAIVILGVCLSIGITTLTNYIILSDTFNRNSGEKIILIARRTGELVQNEIDNEVKVLKAIAMSPYVQNETLIANAKYEGMTPEKLQEQTESLDSLWVNDYPSVENLKVDIEASRLSQFLRDFQKTDPREVEIFITDKYGLNIAMTNRTSDYWQADEEWWQQTSKGIYYISSPVFDESTKFWALNLGIPVQKNNEISSSEITGIVRGTVDITSLLNSIFSIEFGKTGKGYFISSNGNIYSTSGDNLEIHPLPASMQKQLEEIGENWSLDFKDLTGESSIAGVSKVTAMDMSIGWVLVLMHRDEIQANVLSSMQENIWIASILVIVLGFLGSLMSNRILKVIQKLREDVHQIAVGDYALAFSDPVSRSHDMDIQGLVDSINKMKIAVQSREKIILTNEKKYRHLVETMSEGLVMLDRNGNINFSNPRLARMTGYSQQEMKGTNLFKYFPPNEMEKIALQWVSRMDGFQNSYETEILTKNGDRLPVLISPQRLSGEQDEFSGSLAVITDISIQKDIEIAQKKKLNELAGLRKIDIAILEKTSLQSVIQVILDQIRHELNADSASIHIFHPNSTRLRLSRAFIGDSQYNCTKEDIQTDQIRKYIGHKSGILVTQDINDMVIWNGLKNLELRSLFISPIFSKNELKGIMEIAYTRSYGMGDEWFSFFNALATQTAVGIEKIDLFEKLNARNKDLQVAYYSALKGWAKALELRDEETKGHSDRVVEMSISLAREFGFTGEDLENFRNGAFLHDIGKMGVPDSILLKPGKLSDVEWIIMKKHPEFAYQLMNEIPFLKKAIEIPYFHHERWNGSGYPSGLKGKKIPLSARIFAVVDVWDALTSDRPYRKAWSVEDTIQYLQDNRGILFDPEIVDTFLAFMAAGKI